MRRIAHLVTVLIAVAPGVTAAQSWSELKTLTFIPADSRRSGAGESAGVDPSASPAGEQSPERVIARIRAAEAAIEAERAANGEHSAGLVPLFEALADIFLEIDGYGDAIEALEQAQQVVRRREGLYSLDQAGLIERIIDIEMSLAPSEESIYLESELRELVQRNPGDSRNSVILTRMAQRQMNAARHVLIHGVPPEFTFNMNVAIGPGMPRFGSSRTSRSMATSMLRQARFNYGTAIRAAMADGQAELSELFELEDSIIDTYYFELMNSDSLSGSRFGWGRLYSGGINVLEARLSNIRRYAGTPEAVTAARMEIADWHLMFHSFGHAMDLYERALADLQGEDDGEARVAAMFSPERPTLLPAVPNASVYRDLGDEYGYFDVRIEINRFGGVRDVEVTGRSANASDSIERRLKRFVHQARFRPRYVDGEWLSSDRFPMRFEFGYSSS